MSKSPLAVGGLGIAGCLLLTWSMQCALDIQRERERSPLALLLESQFAGRLVGPVRVAAAKPGAISIRLAVFAGLDKQRLAESVRRVAWTYLLRAGAEVASVTVEVHDDEGGPVARLSSAAPGLRD